MAKIIEEQMIQLTQSLASYNEPDFYDPDPIVIMKKLTREEIERRTKRVTNEIRGGNELKVGKRVYVKDNTIYEAQYTVYKAHAKLDCPIAGSFVVVAKKGRALKLKHLKSRETCIVHPDVLIKEKTKVTKKEKEGHHGEEQYQLQPRNKEGETTKK